MTTKYPAVKRSSNGGQYLISAPAFARAAGLRMPIIDRAIAAAGIPVQQLTPAGRELYSLSDLLRRLIFDRQELAPAGSADRSAASTS